MPKHQINMLFSEEDEFYLKEILKFHPEWNRSDAIRYVTRFYARLMWKTQRGGKLLLDENGLLTRLEL